jgi:acyl carrier protein
VARRNTKTGKKTNGRDGGQNSGLMEAVQDWMVTRLAEELKLAPAEINIRIPLVNYGLDSIVAFTLTGELADRLGRDLPATLFWDYPTIEVLARHLAVTEQRRKKLSEHELQSILKDLESMSDEQAQELVTELGETKPRDEIRDE